MQVKSYPTDPVNVPAAVAVPDPSSLHDNSTPRGALRERTPSSVTKRVDRP